MQRDAMQKTLVVFGLLLQLLCLSKADAVRPEELTPSEAGAQVSGSNVSNAI